MNRIAQLVACLTFVGVFSGCGGGSVTGTVSGISLAVQDSIFFVLKDDQGKTGALTVIMADKPNLCDTLKANRQPKSATSLFFYLYNVKIENGAVSLLAPDVGTYTVADLQNLKTSGTYAGTGFSKADANCTDSLTAASSTGKSGSIRLTTVKAEANGNLAGTFDVSIGTQTDKLTGTLNARYCDITKIQANPSCE